MEKKIALQIRQASLLFLIKFLPVSHLFYTGCNFLCLLLFISSGIFSNLFLYASYNVQHLFVD